MVPFLASHYCELPSETQLFGADPRWSFSSLTARLLQRLDPSAALGLLDQLRQDPRNIFFLGARHQHVGDSIEYEFYEAMLQRAVKDIEAEEGRDRERRDHRDW